MKVKHTVPWFEIVVFIVLIWAAVFGLVMSISDIAHGKPRIAPYNRELWGQWSDDNHDGCNRRCELLAARSLIPVTFSTPKAQEVAFGLWMDSYALETLVGDASMLEIDHVVPLKLAWAWGASTWTPAQLNAFYNDPDELNITTVHTNRSKGDRPPSKWSPPVRAERCFYFWKFQRVLQKYGLSAPPAEVLVLGACQ